MSELQSEQSRKSPREVAFGTRLADHIPVGTSQPATYIDGHPGEDRFLSTLMIRTFPARKMLFCPKAKCKTVVPDTFSVLLSQRRRWICSSIHNLIELLKVPNLCGIFCCSMSFIVLLE